MTRCIGAVANSVGVLAAVALAGCAQRPTTGLAGDAPGPMVRELSNVKWFSVDADGHLVAYELATPGEASSCVGRCGWQASKH